MFYLGGEKTIIGVAETGLVEAEINVCVPM